MAEHLKTGIPMIIPEDNELKEDSFWDQAQRDLMGSPELLTIEEELKVLRYQADSLKEVVVASETLKELVSAAEDLKAVETKIKDLRSRRQKEKTRAEKRVKELEAEIERLRKEVVPPVEVKKWTDADIGKRVYWKINDEVIYGTIFKSRGIFHVRGDDGKVYDPMGWKLYLVPPVEVKPPPKPPEIPRLDWGDSWADWNVVHRNFDVFPPEIRDEVKKFTRKWEREYGRKMGAPLKPVTPEDAKRMDEYCDYVMKAPPPEEVTPPVEEKLPPVKLVKVEMGLGRDEKRRLEDLFRRVFLEAGFPRLPPGTISAFRDELARLQEDFRETERKIAFGLSEWRIHGLARTFIPLRPPTPPTPPRAPPAVIRVEIPAEKPREPTFETRHCWKCGKEFTHDVDLEMRLRKPVMRGRFAADVPALAFPEEFYHLCSEHKMEKYNYYSMVDAVAFRVADRSKPNVGFTVTTLRGLGLVDYDIETIVLRAEDYGYKHSSLSLS